MRHLEKDDRLELRTQQSRSNEAEASQMERADAGCSGLLLRRIRCCKHRENALIKESLEDTPSSTRQPEGEDDGADESCGRSDPKRGSSEGKSWNIVRETISSEDFCLAKDKAVLPATSASCKQKGLPAGEQIMRTRQHGEENRPSSSSSTTRSSNTSVQADSSNDTIRKPDQSNVAAKGSRAEAKTGNENVVASTSTESTQASHVTSAKSLAKQVNLPLIAPVKINTTSTKLNSQCTERPTSTQPTAAEININSIKVQIKRKLTPNEDDALTKRTRKENTSADVNLAIDDIQVSNNNKRSIHEESTEDERVAENSVEERTNRRRKRKKRCEKDTCMSEVETRKPVKNIRSVFRSLFGENISKSESEEERALLRSGYVAQMKSIDSCSTETRDSSDNDNVSVDDSRRDVVKDENPVRMKSKVEAFANADTEDVISKNDISIAKTATRVVGNMEGYVNKKEMRKLLRYLRQNLTKMVQKTFERIGQNDKWSSDIKEVLKRRDVRDSKNDKKKKAKNSFSFDGDANSASTNSDSSACPTKAIFDIEDKESDSCNTVDLTPIKDDIPIEDMKVACELIPERGSCIDSILLSDNDNSNASTVIVNHDETPMKENTQKDEAHTLVNENLCVNMFPNQSSMDTDNNQPLIPDISNADNEVELEIKMNSKLESISETLSLKIPPSKRVEYISKVKNNLRRMILGIYPGMATSANASRMETSDVSGEASSTNLVVALKNLKAMAHDSNYTTRTGTNRSLQEENSQDDLRLSDNRENVTESDEAGNDRCVRSTEQESTQLNLVENSVESKAPASDVSDIGKSSSAKNCQNKSRRADEGTLRTNITAEFQPGCSSMPSLDLTISYPSNTTSTITTVASSQMSLQMNTSSTTNVSTSSVSSSAPTWVSARNNQYNATMNEENKLICNIGMLIRIHRIFTRDNINNQQDQAYSILIVLTILRNKILRLRSLLLKGNEYHNWLNYIVYKLNFDVLYDSPTSSEEMNRILLTSKHIRDANKVNTATDDQQSEGNMNNVANMLQQLRGTANSSQQQFSSDMSSVLQTLQLYPTAANFTFPRGSDNANMLETNSQSAININRQQSSGNTTNILKPSQSEKMALNINQRPFSDDTNNIRRLQQSGAATESVERRQSSDNTNNSPLIPQSSPVIANVGRQQFPTSTSNVSYIQQLNLAAEKMEQRQLSTNVDNIPRMPQTSSATVNIRQPQSSNSANSIPLTANVGQFSTNTNNIPHMQQPNPTIENMSNMRLQALANMQNIQYATNKNLNNVAHITERVQPSNSMTMHAINQQQFPRNISYAPLVSNPGQHVAMEKYQQFNSFTGLQPSGNVSNVPCVSHSTVPVSNVNQMSQSTNITVNSVREPLRDLLYVNNQQQFRPEYSIRCTLSLGPRNAIVRPVSLLKNANSLPTNTTASDNIGQGRETSQGIGRATISETNVQRLQQLSGSIPTSVLNIQPIYSNVAMNTRAVNPFIGSQMQIHTPYQIQPIQYTHAYPFLAYLPQSRSPLNLLSATQTSYLSPGTSQKTRSSRQKNFVPVSGMPAISLNSTNVPSGTQQTVTPSKTKQKRKYTRKSKPAPATSSHSELARQEVPKSPLSSRERDVPQNPASSAGAASLGPYASQKKTNDVPSLSHTRETSSAKHVDNASTQMSASQKDSMAKLPLQKQKKDTPTNVVTEDTSKFHALLAINRSEDLSSLPNKPSNSESHDMTQSIENAQRSASQSPMQTTFNFNLDVFTEIQNLIIQNQLKTYFETSFKEVQHVLTKGQADVLKMEKYLLHCFHNFLLKYLSKFEWKDVNMTNKENEAQSPHGKQKESAKQNQTAETRCEKLQKDASTRKATAEATPEDSSTRPQNEEPLRTSNLPKPATTETPRSGLAELPQPETGIKKQNVLRENSGMSREDSAMVMRHTAKPDESAESIEHETQSQKSSVEQISDRSSPILVIDTQSSIDNNEKEFDLAETSFVEHELDICVTQHEHKKLENLSEDVEINSTDLCQSSPEAQNSEVTSKQSTPKCNFEKFERNSKEDIVNVSPIELCQGLPDSEVQYFKIDEQSMLIEEKTQVKKVSRDSETPEQTSCEKKYDRSRTSSIETLRWEDEEEETRLSNRNKLGASDGQLDDSLKTEHHDEKSQVFFVKHEDTNNVDFIINGDFLIDDDVTCNSTEVENSFTTGMLAIFDVCSISQTSYEKIDSNTILVEDDKPQLYDEKENKELSNLSNNSEIVDKQDIKCLRCKRTSTVCCENCLKAYYCSKRCSNLHWNSTHYKSCTPSNCST